MNTAAAPAAPVHAPSGAWLVALPVALFIAVLLLWPVATVLYAALADGHGGLTFAHVEAFFSLSIMREAFGNSLAVSFGAVVLAALIAVPLAYLTVRFEFRGAAIVQTLGVLPLVMPPFVGAVAMQLLFGRNGSVNLLLNDAFGFRIPFMEGLYGVIFVEGLHYFPFILLNLVAAMRNVDSAMEEAAQNLGCHGFRLFRRVVFPLALPGFVAGASLVFVKVFDDLGTPLVLNVTNMLAPQAYLRITSVGVEDPIGYVIAALMVVASIAALALAARITRGRDFATLTRGGGATRRRRLAGWRAVAAYAWVLLVLALVLSPHLGILLLSVSRVWSFSVLPEGFTLAHYGVVLTDSAGMIGNTLLYCSLAALIDVALGVAIAWLVLRTSLPGRRWLDWGASAALAIPGIVLAIGYLRAFRGMELPFGWGAFTASWVAIMLAYSVRRLPYAVRACVAALEQVHASLEEAAQSLGASRWRTVRRVVVPLMAGGILAGFVTSFITAAVELSATILLVTRESQAPLSYGIYLYNQSIATRGPAAALGVIAVVIVALGTFASHRLLERRSNVEAANP
ncbi:MAG: iron ABC transporter permease [Betaproteobacteria bacterium]|nr:iron ABC transporter permease [Betaproteobacteria bacterium]